MIKVVRILEIDSTYIICEMNNGAKKKLNIAPLIKMHAAFKGIEQLNNENFFRKVQVGEMGEIFWKDAVTTSSNQTWNYDISPEYINFYGENV